MANRKITLFFYSIVILFFLERNDNMKIVFITNMMNHHQKPVADYLYQKFGDNYHFVTTMPIPKNFLNVGYKNNDDCPYINTALN